MIEGPTLTENQRLRKRAERERRARQEAELIAERGLRQLYDRQRELELLNSIADAANGATSIETAIQVTLEKVCTHMDWPIGHAYLVGDDPDTLHSSSLWHLDPRVKIAAFRKVTEDRSFRKGEGLPGRVLECGHSIWIVDVSTDKNFPRSKYVDSQDIGVFSAFAFPVMAGATVVAVLEFFSTTRVQSEETWLRIAEQAGRQLGRTFERKRASDQLEKVHSKLVGVSRAAGMAEVATGVLHNVGNVLNSVSVSATVVCNRLRKSEIGDVQKAANLLLEKNGQLAQYLTSDPRGKLLPQFLAKASTMLATERDELIREMAAVAEHIEHIKEIVAMQQTYAKVLGVLEPVSPASLVEDALRMNSAAFDRHGVHIFNHVGGDFPNVMVDRHKVLQILTNLIRNAKYAMDEHNPAQKRLEIHADKTAEGQVAIRIKDNGVGIPTENLTRIFGHGFTTKKDGHGFGLHSGALAAKEMNGSLTVQSDGLGKGAVFTLTVPAADRKEVTTETSEIEEVTR